MGAEAVVIPDTARSFVPTVRLVEREFNLAPEVESIARAREAVHATLSELAGHSMLTDVELVVSELVTNSVRHGPGKPIVLRLSSDDEGGVFGEVEDQGDGVVEIRNQDVGSVVGGLGLPIVDRLTSEWGVYAGSTHVWFRFAS